MDVYTAFLFGVLVGQWVLLFAIWRAVTKLVRLLNTMESESVQSPGNRNTRGIELLDDGQSRDDRYRW
jgi:hypothetical protein